MPRVVLPGRMAKWCWEIFKTKALSSHAICPVQFDTLQLHLYLVHCQLVSLCFLPKLSLLLVGLSTVQVLLSHRTEDHCIEVCQVHQNPPNRSFTTICVHLNSPFSVSSKFVMIDLWHVFIRNNTISIYKGMYLNSLRNFRKYFDSKKNYVFPETNEILVLHCVWNLL